MPLAPQVFATGAPRRPARACTASRRNVACGPTSMTTRSSARSGFGRAVADANLTKNDIDGLASAGYGGMHEVQLAEYLGLTPHWLDSTSCGGSSFEFHALHAYRAIQAGDADTVAIVYGNNELSAA